MINQPVFGTEMVLLTFLFLIIQFVLVFIHFGVIISRPYSKANWRFLLLVLLFINYSICSGLIDNSSWSQRCGSSKTNYSHPWRSGDGNNVFGNPRAYSDVFRFYSGMKQLKNYYFRVRLRCENNNIPTSTQSYTTYFTDYIVIQDN